MNINWSAVYAIIIRHLYTWRRDFDRVIDAFWFATTDLIFWGLTSTYLTRFSIGFNLVVVFIGAIIFWTVIQNAQREINMPLLDEAWNRNLINLFTAPVSLIEFVIATIILGLLKLIMVILLLGSLAYFLYRFNIFNYGWYLLPALVNLTFIGWWVGFFIDGLIFRFGYKIQSFAWAFIFVLYPFSAVLYPVEILPFWAQTIAKLLPSSYVFENMRSVLLSGKFNPIDIQIAVTLNLIYLILSISFLQLMFKNALANGRLTKLN